MSEGQADGQAQAVAELQARLVDAQNERDTWHNRYRTIIAQTLAILPNISAPPDPAASPKESGKDSPAPVPNVSLEDNNTKIEDVEDFVRRVRETVDYQARALENVKSKAHEKINKLNDEKRALVKKMKDLVNQFKTSEAKLNEEKKQMQDDQSRMMTELINARTTKEEASADLKQLRISYQQLHTEAGREKSLRMQAESQWSDLKSKAADLRQQLARAKLDVDTAVSEKGAAPSVEGDADQHIQQLKMSLQCAKEQALQAMTERDSALEQVNTMRSKLTQWASKETPSGKPSEIAAAVSGETSGEVAAVEKSVQGEVEIVGGGVRVVDESMDAPSKSGDNKAKFVAQMWQEAQQERDKLKTELEAVLAKDKALASECEGAKQTVQNLTSQVTALQASIEEREGRITKLRNLLAQTTKRVEEFRNALTAAHRKLKEAPPPPWALQPSALQVRVKMQNTTWCLMKRPATPATANSNNTQTTLPQQPQTTTTTTTQSQPSQQQPSASTTTNQSAAENAPTDEPVGDAVAGGEEDMRWVSEEYLIKHCGPTFENVMTAVELLLPEDLSKEARRLRGEVECLQDCIVRLENEHSTLKSSHHQQITQLEDEYRQYRERAAAVLRSKDGDSEVVEGLRRRTDELEGELDKLTTQLTQETECHKLALEACRGEIDRLQAALGAAESTAQQRANEVARLRHQHAQDLNKINDNHRKAERESEVATRSLEAQIASERKLHSETKTELETMGRTCDQLRASLQQLKLQAESIEITANMNSNNNASNVPPLALNRPGTVPTSRHNITGAIGGGSSNGTTWDKKQRTPTNNNNNNNNNNANNSTPSETMDPPAQTNNNHNTTNNNHHNNNNTINGKAGLTRSMSASSRGSGVENGGTGNTEELRMVKQELSQLQENIREGEQMRQLERRQTEVLKTQIRELQRELERSTHTANLEYLKNVVAQYIEMGTEHHTRLFPVLATLLQFSPEEMARIDAAIASRTTSRNRFWPLG